uniref:Plectin n=1 Tax=Canis lupus familiaris TaxID=9615 RepID=A0A8I3RTC1_CANLF
MPAGACRADACSWAGTPGSGAWHPPPARTPAFQGSREGEECHPVAGSRFRRAASPALPAACSPRAMEPSGSLFPSLVVVGHVVTLAAVWHWRRGRWRVQDVQDERDRVQKKTFTKWVNKHLIKHWRAEAQRHISDLYEDLRDGHNLISLLEVLSGDSLPREKGRMRFHKLQNVQIALDYLRHRQVKLVNIRNDDIADGNPKLTLGLIWTIILHFQISDIQVSGQSEDMTAKEKLLLWSQRMVEGYQGLRCDNFTSSWRDGRLFNAIIHRHRPMLIDMSKVYRQTNLENLDQAFSVAERDLGVTRLLDPEDVDVPQPDEKSIITYVSSLYDAMPRVPDVQDGVKANELQLRWQEYRELVVLLLQWMRHHTAAFEEHRFPSSFEEIEILWCQFLKFKETELPAKEADKNRSKGIYQSLEGAVQAGQLKVPPGYHPLDVEKEWGKLHVAILDREKQLRSEFERLECLQRIVSKLQMEAGLCEEQLNHADALLQSDVRLLAASKAPQRAAEVERDLDKADGMIRLLFNDVQTLKDGRHPQGEQMYRRVYRLHERLVAIRTEYNLRLKSGVAAPVTQVTMQTTQRRPELEDATLRYLQDLLAWVEENQRRVDSAEWGGDLPSVEAQLGSHRGLHQSIDEFRAKIERARADEGQLSPAPRGTYRDCLGRLDLQYAKLLNSSKARLRSLESLHGFVAAATKELMWLSEKEEEEVGFDWGEHNSNMAAKKESYSALMRELEVKEKKIKEIQSTGDRLLREGHPARPTVESFQAALQTQWSWMLQLCCCIEAHLKENTAYFQFFSDVRETEEQLRKLQEMLRRKYICDRSITVTRLEDLLQDAQDEKEQLNEYRAHLSGLAKRAKAVVQLKPRDQAQPVRGLVPLQAVCDYKQVEVTVHKGDQYQLLGPAQPAHWKVLSSSGSEAAVPSVCFLVPPPNQEAQEAVSRLEAQHQALVALWHQLHVDMKSLLAWQCLSRDVQLIRSWSLVTFRTLKPEEQRQALRSLELHYQAFLRDSQDAGGFGPEDRLQAEREYGSCSRHYQQLLQSAEQGAQEESRCQRCISELKDIRLQLEACETRTVHRLRLPLDKEPARECAQRIAEQQKAQAEVEGLGKGVARLSAEAEKVLALPEPSPAAPTLRSELELTLGKLEQVRSLSAIYLEKLKTISLVIRSTQGAEEVLRAHEEQLKEAQAVPATLPDLEATKAALKKLRVQAEAQQPVFDALRDELRGAQEVGERLQRQHGERDVEVERWRERVAPLLERWQAALAQTDVRQRELEQLGRQLRYYRESADPLGTWLQDAKQRQERIQAVPLANSQAVREQLQQEKELLEEIERYGEKVDECQQLAKQYINAIKDYELQLVTYKAQLEPVASPAKKPKVQSGSESVIQEYVDLRTRYSELTTLTSQYIKFIRETLRRMEEEERLAEQQRAEERERLAEVEAALEKQRQLAEAHAQAKAQAEREAEELQRRMQEEVARREEAAVDAQQQKRSIQEELQHLRQSSEAEIQAKARQVEAAERSRVRIEEEIRVVRLQLEATERQRGGAEGELQALRARAEEAEAQKRQAQEEAERLRRQVQDESQRKRQAEAELALRVKAEAEAAREKQRALQALEDVRLQAEEAERRLRQAEADRARQVQVALETAQRSAEVELQSKRASFAEKTAQLERTLQEEHVAVAQLREEAERRAQQQAEAERAREEAEQELERWRLKANEALRLRLQAEEVAQQKSLAQAEAEKQKEEAEREARRRGKAEEQAVRQRELAEQELEKQRQLAEGTAQQRLVAEQELIRLRAETEQGEQQRQLLEEELARLQREAAAATHKRQELEAELAKVRAEMEVLLASKARAEEESRSTSEKSKQRLEAEASRFRELAEEAARLRALAEETKRQRQLAEEDAARQRAEAERVLAEKLAAISEATRLKTEAEIALKEKEAENERLRRLAEDEAFQRRRLEEQAAQHKADIEERLAQLRKASENELERQKGLVEDTLRQRRQVEEEILALKASFEKAAAGKAELELELGRIRSNAEDTLRSKEQAELEATRQRQLAAEEEQRRREAEERVQKSLAAEEEAARQRKSALEEVERLKAKVEEARRLRERAEQESARQLQLAQEAAQKRLQAEEKAHAFAVQQKEQELQQTLQQEQSMLERLRAEAEAARRAAEEAEEARERAEREAAQSRRQVEEAERLKQLAEEQAQAQAQAQAAAEKLRKEAEQEAVRRAQAEQAALKQKQVADAEMEKHKKFAEQTLRQKAQVEQELTTLRLQLEETDHQKSILDEELQRLKAEVTEAARQRNQVEEELFSVRVQMEELSKLKARIEAENRALILRDKDNTQRFLQEEAEKMKQVAEEAARLSVAAQEAARLRQLAEEDLAQQRALAEKMLKEKMQAVQEATRLKAEAELLQQQKELAQEQARQLQEDKEQMAQQLAQETQGFQRTLEAERQRQLEMSAEAERLKLRVAEMSRAQARAEEDAQRFRKQAEEIGEKLHRTELATQEKVTLVHTLEIQRQQSDHDAERLRAAITELEREKEKLQEEATLLQQKSEEMQVVQQEQLLQETRALQESFLSEKDRLLQRERFIEQEKAKLEQLFRDEVAKAQKLREEQQRQQQQMEQEREQLVASMEEARQCQREAEEGVRRKQEELQLLEQQRQQQERLLAEENQRLRERLQRLEEEHRAALAHSEEIAASQAAAAKALPNGRDAPDGPAVEAEPEHMFDGLRRKVPAQRLQEVGILSAEELQRLAQGRTTVAELAQREDVCQYLQGRGGIAGLLLKPANEKLSIYAALRRQLLSPGTALILLEAQAATGFLLDPVQNRRLTVNEAVKEGVVGPELHHKLLSAERAVTGYKDPYTGEQISLFQAMQKELIVRDHGIRLLEAQIATGGIIDPVHSHRLPVDVAYQRGYFDEEMNRVLADPSDDTKGFFDPNTHENLTYLQLLERCVLDPETGLRLLPLTDQAARGGELVYTDSEARDVFEKATVSAPFGKFQGRTVTIWELINSEYFTTEQRRDLLRQFRMGKVTVEKIIKIVITVVEEHEQKGQLCFEGLRALVPAAELLESGVIDHNLYRQLQRGERSVREVAEVDAVRRALRGTSVIAGVWLEETGQRLSIYEALKKDLLPPEVAVALLEAQAGTGHIIDPATSARLTVDEAVRAGLVGPELHEKLLSAEKAVTGYKDPYSGQSVSLFQALKKGLIPREQGLRLLDAQLSTGGIVDPSKSHRVPMDVAYARGYLDQETSRALSAPQDEAKTYHDPSTQEPVTYGQLQQQCRPDPLTGLSLLPLSEQAAQARREGLYSELQARETFQKTPVEVPVGSFKGRTVTVWELLSSEYFTTEQRQELLRQFRTGTVTVEKIIKIVITIVEEVETVRQERLSFSGLRAPVPASELLASGVLSRTQFEQLKDGKTSVKDLSELSSVRTLLQGSGCLAGIYLEESKEKVTIYEAMRRGLLRPSTATLLLEAQAATGFLIDPVRNQRLYVHEAVKAGVVGPELHEKLLSAEKAVTGYKDPYSGSTISLFQAMKKGLVLREHGIRLLEAQIATGGIIDPVHSHRLPVDVAYQRGYFDEEMNRVLADPSDDTKGFFDPNTHENLTYLQLLERCVEDPETGLRLLPLKGAEKTEVVESTQVYTEEETRRAFEETQIDIPGSAGRSGSTMSLWEVMQSDLIPEEQRTRLMADFQAGRVTKERMIIIIIEIIEKTEIVRQQNLASYDYVRRRLTAEDLYEARIISRETYSFLREGTKSLRQVLEEEEASRYLYGTGCVAGVYLPGSRQTLTIYQALKKGLLNAEVARFLLEAQAATGFLLEPVKGERLTVDEAVRKGLVGPELHDRLLSAERAVTGYRDPYTEQTISLFQAMKKDLIPTDEALRLLDAQLATGGIVDPHLGFHLPLEVAYQRGYLNKDTHDQLSEPSEVRSYLDPSTDERLSYTQLLRRCRRHETSGQMLLPLSDARKLTFRGLRKQITVEELVRSQVLDEATALQLQEGLTSVEEVTKNLQKFLEGTSCIAGVFVDATKERLSVGAALTALLARRDPASPDARPPDPRGALRAATMEVKLGRLRGPAVPVWDVLASSYVSGATREQLLLAGFGSGTLGLAALTRRLTTIIEEVEAAGGPERAPGDAAGVQQEPRPAGPGGDGGRGAGPSPGEAATEPAGGPQEQALRAATMEVQAGPLRGQQRPSVWDVLFSSYLSRARRDELLAQHAAGALALPGLVAVLTRAVEEAEERLSKVTFRGLRRQVSASELRSSGILGPETLRDLAQGTKTPQEVTEMDSVKRYLRGTSCIAGVLVPAKDEPGRQEKMSVYQAMWKGVLRPGTALVLLEAQAATGFLIDPVRNQRLTVEEAVAAGLVGGEIQDKLLSAERAVTGYTDPYTGEQISLFQAMQKELIVRDHGIRLLEAQVATGGIIDPVHSHRLPVDVAYQRGYFDEEMNRVLADPSDDTKGFFDPNTHENLTYVQLLRRCVLDPDTGLYMLQLAGGGSAVHQLSEELRGALRDARVAPGPGVAQGQSVSVWELLFYREVPEGERQDLLRRYRAGSLTAHEVGAALTALLARRDPASPGARPPDPRGALRAATMEVKLGRLRGPAVPVWDVLASSYVSGATREQLLAGFGSGTLGLAALTRRLTTIIEEVEAAGGPERAPGDAAGVQQEPRPAGPGGDGGRGAGPSPGEAATEPAGGPQEQALRAATMEVQAGPLRGQRPSVWDVLFSSYLSRARRDELLAQHAAGALALPGLVAVLTRAVRRRRRSG